MLKGVCFTLTTEDRINGFLNISPFSTVADVQFDYRLPQRWCLHEGYFKHIQFHLTDSKDVIGYRRIEIQHLQHYCNELYRIGQDGAIVDIFLHLDVEDYSSVRISEYVPLSQRAFFDMTDPDRPSPLLDERFNIIKIVHGKNRIRRQVSIHIQLIITKGEKEID